ncbi:hypothetical protein ColTof4_05595 [Colletotrichum tofieldiae]|nr:hypothetical protein ColTof3_00754 [Colletotrichum tofieldiae]GKT73172.1 hypothetical protein ColTof4_05595 [Colletotrichum tofieldiae]GKT88166.1 hypothetical protein Ct61P_06016 [Colletotrichum tofieldiae]
MVNLTFLVTAALATTAYAYAWKKCTNAPRCVSSGWDTYSGTGLVGFTYDSSNQYWYSYKLDGLFVSPAGYFQPAHRRNFVDVTSKDPSLGTTYWLSSDGKACCLPDEVGTNIANVKARST